MDDPEFESDESAEVGVKNKRRKHMKYDEKRIGMSAEPADG